MNARHLITIVCAILLLSGCSYKATTNINPATSIYSNYADKVPGKYALYVDAEEMMDIFKVSGYACSAHKYPVDARHAFRVSVERTLENIIEELEVVDSPLDRVAIRARKLSGMIVVEADELEIDLTVIPGFWSAKMKADVEITAKVQIDNEAGRLLGTSVEGDDDYLAESGGACAGGAKAIGIAIEKAMKETFERMGERISNSPRLRKS